MLMNKRIIYSLSFLFIFSTLLAAIGCSSKSTATPYVAEEFVACNASGNQITPHISGDIVVWEDDRNGNADIYGYNLSDSSEIAICTNISDQSKPDVDHESDAVVWQDNRNGNYDIYGYNISARTEFIICNESNDQGTPSISGDTVVWMDGRDDIGNVNYIYGYNLSSGEEFPISTYQTLNSAYLSSKMFPSIYKDTVTWLDFRKVNLSAHRQQPDTAFNTEIYGYNLSSSLEFAITDDEYTQDPPGAAIYGDILVWSECNESICGIYSYNLTTHTKSALTTSHETLRAPVIYGNIVVWEDYRNGNGDIYGYNLATGEEFAICTDPGYQSDPAISGNIVVWSDKRNGNSDIYGARLTFDNK
jgi:TolB protein